MPIVTNTEILKFLQASGVTVTSAGQDLITMIQPMIEALIAQRLGYQPAQATYTEFYPSGDTNNYFSDDGLLGAGYDMVNGSVLTYPRGMRQQRFISLKNLPVRSITSVYENYAAWYGGTAGGDWPTTSLLPANSYYLDLNESGLSWSGQLVRNVGVWPGALRTVKVTYVGGLSADELNTTYSGIKLATLLAIGDAYSEMMAKAMSSNFGGTVSSIGIEDFSVGIAGPASMGSAGQLSATAALTPKASAMLAPYINVGAYFGIN